MSEGVLGSVNWNLPTWDLFIIIFFLIAVVVYGLSLGRERVLVVLTSIYISLAITTNLPFINSTMSKKFGLGPVFVLQILVFFCCIAGLFFLFSRMGVLAGFSGNPSLPIIGLFSVLQVGLLISIVLSFLPDTAMSNFSPMIKFAFTSDITHFLWILAPIGALYLLRQKDDSPSPSSASDNK